MAVRSEYVNTNTAAGKLAKAIHSNGGKTFTMVQTFEVAAADDDASIFRLFKNLPADLVPLSIKVMTDGMTGSTDWDIGLYETGLTGVAVDADCLADGITLAVAKGRLAYLDGLVTVDIASIGSMLYELGSHTTATRKSGYDLVMTANTIGSAAGTVSVIAEFAQG